MQFALAPGTYITLIEGDVVLLDARADRYACLAACHAGPLRAGYPARRWKDGPLVRELAGSGYLVAASAIAPAMPEAPSPPETDLYMLGGDRPDIRPSDLCLGALAGLSAAWQLAVERPMHWLRPNGHDMSNTDRIVDEARRFAEVHLYLPRLARCLPHSLALNAFLQRRECPSQLVFGVRTHPFEAHCWVQSGAVVLNDTLSHVRWYTPIAWN